MKIKKIPTLINEHFPETQSVLGLMAFPGATSASRKQMNANNLGQLVVVNGLSERHIQTGMEAANLPDTTFAIKMPASGVITDVIHRYNSNKEGVDVIKENPQTVLVYRDDITGEYGMVNLVEHCSYHPYIGFKYVKKPAFFRIKVDEHFDKDEVFLDTPALTKENVYRYGVMANVAFMTHPATSEDGILINRAALEKFGFRTYERRVVEFGNDTYPLNLYCTKFDENGQPLEYKIHPEIGEYIRDDGVLMATRSYDPKTALFEMSRHATTRIDGQFDKAVYVAGAGGRIVDIKVHHDRGTNRKGAPPSMEQQTMKYDDERRQFYSAVHDMNKRVEWQTNKQGVELNLSPELHRLCVEAISVIGSAELQAQKVNKKVPLDDWTIEFVIEYINIPNIGNKFTDDYGGKGVVCAIAEPWEMPVDEHGNVADFVFDPGSTVNRMIPSRLYEQYFNAASRDVWKSTKEMLNVPTQSSKGVIQAHLENIQKTNPELFYQAWNRLMRYYEVTVPRQHDVFANNRHKSTPLSHLTHLMDEGFIVLHIRTDHELEYKNMVADVEEEFAPLWGPVTYVDPFGRKVTTRRKIRIAPMHILMLEKIADSWSAVASARMQHYGVLATMSNQDKYSQPIRHNPTRAFGESEIRILASYTSSKVAAEILDRNNSIHTHKEIVRNILRAPYPTNIDLAVDRNKIPYGGARPLQLVKHIARCGGWRPAYKPFVPSWQTDHVNYRPLQ